jgi:hypothetical protein
MLAALASSAGLFVGGEFNNSYLCGFALLLLAVYFLAGAPKPLNSRCCCNIPFFGSAIEFMREFHVLNDYLVSGPSAVINFNLY